MSLIVRGEKYVAPEPFEKRTARIIAQEGMNAWSDQQIAAVAVDFADFRQDSAGKWRLSVNAQAAAERLLAIAEAYPVHFLGVRSAMRGVLEKYGTIDDKRDHPKE